MSEEVDKWELITCLAHDIKSITEGSSEEISQQNILKLKPVLIKELKELLEGEE